MVATFDKAFENRIRVMDFLSPAGFAPLVNINTSTRILEDRPSDFSHPRLVLHTILCLLPESVCLMGPDCSSWGLPARGASQRNYMNSLGAVHLNFVNDSNVTISRKLRC